LNPIILFPASITRRVPPPSPSKLPQYLRLSALLLLLPFQRNSEFDPSGNTVMIIDLGEYLQRLFQIRNVPSSSVIRRKRCGNLYNIKCARNTLIFRFAQLLVQPMLPLASAYNLAPRANHFDFLK
jgi:hypothetical protein